MDLLISKLRKTDEINSRFKSYAHTIQKSKPAFQSLGALLLSYGVLTFGLSGLKLIIPKVGLFLFTT